MRNCLKKQFTKSIKCSFVFLLFVVLFSVSVFSIQLNNCSINGQQYVDLQIYDNVTQNNWSSFTSIQSRNTNYSGVCSVYFSNLKTSQSQSYSSSINLFSKYTPVFAVDNDFVYVLSKTNIFYQINVSTDTNFESFSNLTYSFFSGITYTYFNYPYNEISSMPLVKNGSVYIGDGSGFVFQLNSSNISKQIGKFSSGFSITSSPILVNDYIYITNTNGVLFQLNSSNVSKQISNYSIGKTIYSTPIFSQGYIFIGTYDGFVYKFNASNINSLISISNNLSQNIIYSPSIDNNFVYYPVGRYLFKINISNMNDIQNMTLNITTGSPKILNDFLYVSGNTGITLNTGILYMINLTNFEILKNVTQSYFFGSPLVIDGYLYHTVLASFNTYITQYDATNLSNLIFSQNAYVTFKDDATCGTFTLNTIKNSVSSPYKYNNRLFITEYSNFCPPELILGKIRTFNSSDGVFYHLQQCPTISFVNLTETSATTINRSYMHINTSVILGTWNITILNIYIYNKTNQIDNFFTTFQNLFLNYSPITNTTYYFNASVTDVKGNIVWTEKRNITNLKQFIALILGNCFDKIKNQDETDTDYNGICGYCKNLTFYSDDTSFQVLRESDLYKYPFNQSQCSQGDAVVGSYTFLILLITLGIFVVGGLLLFFFGIPLLIFAITGSFKFSWWNLIFGGKKKKKEDNEETETQ